MADMGRCNMNRRQIIFVIILTAVVAVSLSALIVTTINDVNNQVEQECFDKLADTSRYLADEIKRAADSDRTILTAMADIISGMENPSKEKLCGVLNTYRYDASYISYTELLFPDNKMLYADSTVRDVSEALSFTEEAAAGAYISKMMRSTLDTDEMVIRHAVPVVQNGRTIYILYGVIRLSDLAEKYKTDIYDGQAYVFIEDGDTGDFLLDTWHKTLGNIDDYSDRKLEPGYSWDIYINELRAGKSGRLAFTSKTTGEVLLLRYDPTGVNNWNIMVMVPKAVALREREAVSLRLYCMAAIIVVVMLLYMFGVTCCLFSAYRKVRKLSNEDQTTGLQNRNAYNRFFVDIQSMSFASLCCVFVDVNGLHEVNNKYGHNVGDQMLQIVAGALLKEFPFKQVFRFGGDEFVVMSDDYDANECTIKMERVAQQVATHDCCISYGIAYRENTIGADRIAQEADARMLENKRAYYAEHDRRRPRED
jgi:diguanylate cyclase (GGDEF)-like protein